MAEEIETPRQHPRDKYPSVYALKQKLEAEKAAIVAKSKPLRDRRDMLAQKIEPIVREMAELAKQFKAIEGERLAEIDNEISACTRAMGGRFMSDGSK